MDLILKIAINKIYKKQCLGLTLGNKLIIKSNRNHQTTDGQQWLNEIN